MYVEPVTEWQKFKRWCRWHEGSIAVVLLLALIALVALITPSPASAQYYSRYAYSYPGRGYYAGGNRYGERYGQHYAPRYYAPRPAPSYAPPGGYRWYGGDSRAYLGGRGGGWGGEW